MVPRLGDSRVLASSGRGGAFHADTILQPIAGSLDIEGVVRQVEFAGEGGGEDAGNGDLVLVARVQVVVVHVLDRAGRVVSVPCDVHEGFFVVLQK